MGRRRSPFDDLMEYASRLPWGISVALAILSFVLMHGVPILQFLLPAGFLIGAAGSILRRSQSHTLFNQAAAGTRRAIADMSWGKFERLVGEAFRRRGYEVTETGGSGSDGGIDLVLRKNGERWLVQCKHWRWRLVGVRVVRELYGVISAQGAAGGFVVTSGKFTREARRFAQNCGVELIDGDGLEALIREVERTSVEQKDRALVGTPRHDPLLPALSAMPRGCPKCGAVMEKRLAKRGRHAGTEFWGCSRYPNCRGTLPLA